MVESFDDDKIIFILKANFELIGDDTDSNSWRLQRRRVFDADYGNVSLGDTD